MTDGELRRALDGVFSPCEFEVRTNGYGNVELVIAPQAATRLAALIETAPEVPPPEVDEHADDPVSVSDDDRPPDWGKLL